MPQVYTVPPSTKSAYQSNWEKGHAFEDYIISLFDKKKFNLLHWRSDKISSSGMFVESNNWPDLVFTTKGNFRQRFAIECKWRKKVYNDVLGWANTSQIRKYLDYQKQYGTVYVAIGIGGDPSSPENLYLTFLDNIAKYPNLYLWKLQQYVRPGKTPIEIEDTQLKLF